jgi:hypothetical protein
MNLILTYRTYILWEAGEHTPKTHVDDREVFFPEGGVGLDPSVDAYLR